jgi:hypothetical protein
MQSISAAAGVAAPVGVAAVVVTEMDDAGSVGDAVTTVGWVSVATGVDEAESAKGAGAMVGSTSVVATDMQATTTRPAVTSANSVKVFVAFILISLPVSL